ncbi:helix-turn-helix transcriptional regulator [Fodinicurvata fenggangensis]|uniref:helix-turn-helix transcriptional regulator n=1 Tax=Fodinicurvata fenggangensis TaxID=1121830 RepID=UPI00047C223A|nr:WYL domain-containing protein [Fodinicurvata fenggangensis]
MTGGEMVITLIVLVAAGIYAIYFKPSDKERVEKARKKKAASRPQARPRARREAEDDRLVDMDGPDNLDEWPLCLVYEAADGEVTEREVDTLRLVQRKKALYLYAWCHQADDLRTFRVDRIQELTDLETGEVTDDAEGYLKARVIDDLMEGTQR